MWTWVRRKKSNRTDVGVKLFTCAYIGNHLIDTNITFFGNWHSNRKRRRDCKYFIPKKRVHIFFHSTKTEAVVLMKESDKTWRFFFSFFKMSLFTMQNGSFCRAKWFILSSKTGHFQMQNESFWKLGKCKENTSRFFSVPYSFLIFRAYASVGFLFWKDGLHFV